MFVSKKSLIGACLVLTLGLFGIVKKVVALCNCNTSDGNKIIDFSGISPEPSCKDVKGTVTGKKSGGGSQTVTVTKCSGYSGNADTDLTATEYK